MDEFINSVVDYVASLPSPSCLPSPPHPALSSPVSLSPVSLAVALTAQHQFHMRSQLAIAFACPRYPYPNPSWSSSPSPTCSSPESLQSFAWLRLDKKKLTVLSS